MAFRHDFTCDEMQSCAQFAALRYEQSGDYYRERHSRPEKVKADTTNGTLGEIAAQRALVEQFGHTATVSEVDFTLYKGKQKTWDPDLYVTFRGYEAHAPIRVQVKTHVCNRYRGAIPKSFMFQKPGTGAHEDKHLAQIKVGGSSTDWFMGVLGYVKDKSKLARNGCVRDDAVADFGVVVGPYSLQSIVDAGIWRPPEAASLNLKQCKKQCLWLEDLEAYIPKIACLKK